MHQASSFILELARTISDDIRDSVAPEKLQFEVEIELENQILAKTVAALHEYMNSRSKYNREDQTTANIKRRQALRYMGYCNEMWTAIGIVKGALTSSSSIDADFEIFNG